MATVHVTTTNNSGKSVSLTLDDEADADQIEYLKKLVRREELADVKVTRPAAKKAAAPKTDD